MDILWIYDITYVKNFKCPPQSVGTLWVALPSYCSEKHLGEEVVPYQVTCNFIQLYSCSTPSGCTWVTFQQWPSILNTHTPLWTSKSHSGGVKCWREFVDSVGDTSSWPQAAQLVLSSVTVPSADDQWSGMKTRLCICHRGQPDCALWGQMWNSADLPPRVWRGRAFGRGSPRTEGARWPWPPVSDTDRRRSTPAHTCWAPRPRPGPYSGTSTLCCKGKKYNQFRKQEEGLYSQCSQKSKYLVSVFLSSSEMRNQTKSA